MLLYVFYVFSEALDFPSPPLETKTRRQATRPGPKGPGPPPLPGAGEALHSYRNREAPTWPLNAGEGRGFYPSTGAPRSGWWGSAPSHFPPRPLQGRLRTSRARDPAGARRGPPRAHSPPGPSRLDPGGFRPVAALGGTVRTVLDYSRSFFLLGVRGFPVPSFPSPSLPVSVPAPLHHRRGTPARRAMLPGMPTPRLDPEAGLARGCGEEGERVRNCQKLPVIVKCPENR
jgi:hypothetical protein